MKNKTAIEELIEKLYESYNWKHSTFQEKAGIASCINKAKRMLEKEKSQIITAYDKGKSDFANYEPERHGNESPKGEKYYNNKFK